MILVRRRAALVGAASATLAASVSVSALAQESAALPRESVTLASPPFVHAHEQATRDPPKIVEFKLVVHEKPVVIDDEGTTLQAMTFNGTIPGPMMVVHEGDYLELTLVNPATNVMTHNIDFHASTGALGGGELTLINPGEEVVLRFKATRAGPCAMIASTMSARAISISRAMRTATSSLTLRSWTPIPIPWASCASSSRPMSCSTAGLER